MECLTHSCSWELILPHFCFSIVSTFPASWSQTQTCFSFRVPHGPRLPPFPAGLESHPFSGSKMPIWPSHAFVAVYCPENKNHDAASSLERGVGYLPPLLPPTPRPLTTPHHSPPSSNQQRFCLEYHSLYLLSAFFSLWPPVSLLLIHIILMQVGSQAKLLGFKPTYTCMWPSARHLISPMS